MKTLQELRKEISDLRDTDFSQLKKPQVSRIKKRIQFLKMCIRYIETNPDPEFLKKEILRLNNKTKLIEDQFKLYVSPQTFDNEKKKKTFYNKEMGLPKISEQIKTLRFIIN